MRKLVQLQNIKKVLRFTTIYGLNKTLFKVAGRSRRYVWLARLGASEKKDVGVIGCGQFAFATIGYAICHQFGNRFGDCFDIDKKAQQTFANFFKIPNSSQAAPKLINNPKIKYVYISSNHASHADYAIASLQAGKTVYVEKPIAVDRDQLGRLVMAVVRAEQPIYAGYNRPFSSAVRQLRKFIDLHPGPLTLNCFISGHMIPENHWYRKPEEGTRVCGNIGHWLDLLVHVLSWGELPDTWNINVTYANPATRDDNLSIAMSSERGDLFGITLTSRCEPFEGINETINYQCGEVIAKIDDFRKITIWKRDKLSKYRFWPKDVGHNIALLQPFKEIRREWKEIVQSSLLMLTIKEMVLNGIRSRTFSFSEQYENLIKEFPIHSWSR